MSYNDYNLIIKSISVIIDIENIVNGKLNPSHIHFVLDKINLIIEIIRYITIVDKRLKINIREGLLRIFDALTQVTLPNRLIISPLVLLKSELNCFVCVIKNICNDNNIDYECLRKEVELHE